MDLALQPSLICQRLAIPHHVVDLTPVPSSRARLRRAARSLLVDVVRTMPVSPRGAGDPSTLCSSRVQLQPIARRSPPIMPSAHAARSRWRSACLRGFPVRCRPRATRYLRQRRREAFSKTPKANRCTWPALSSPPCESEKKAEKAEKALLQGC